MNSMLLRGWKTKLTREAADTGGGHGDVAPPVDPAPGDTSGPDYSFLPEEFLGDDGPNIDGFKEHYAGVLADKTRYDEMRGQMPEDASGYEWAIPEIDYSEMGLPEDFKVEFNPEDEVMAPLLSEFGQILHKHGLPSGASKEMMGALAKYEALTQKKLMDAARADAEAQSKALGPSAQNRIDGVKRVLEQRLPAEQAKGLMDAIGTADGVRALEKLLGTRALGGATPQPPAPKSREQELADYYSNPT